ncbi:MAG TPA: hypothetical protein VI837_10165 [Blastocatellia bacterium]|nr:hypothetical protein [Blastocatellia bacterium]
MNGCKYTKERIDEAENPDLLPFDVSEHIGQCDDCERFALERTALRELVAAGTRVSAPINFDAMLKARLAEVKAERSFWWPGAPGYLRLGAATAGLVVMIFVAQYAGLLSKPDPSVGVESPPKVAANQPSAGDLVLRGPQLPAPETNELDLPALRLRELENRLANGGSRAIRVSRRDASVATRTIPDGYLTAEDGGVVLVRVRNGDMDVQMPTVSVGAQPLLYVSAGRRTLRNVGTSF